MTPDSRTLLAGNTEWTANWTVGGIVFYGEIFHGPVTVA